MELCVGTSNCHDSHKPPSNTSGNTASSHAKYPSVHLHQRLTRQHTFKEIRVRSKILQPRQMKPSSHEQVEILLTPESGLACPHSRLEPCHRDGPYPWPLYAPAMWRQGHTTSQSHGTVCLNPRHWWLHPSWPEWVDCQWLPDITRRQTISTAPRDQYINLLSRSACASQDI